VQASGIRRVSSETTYFMVQLRFETSSAEFAALQQAVFVADGIRDENWVRHTGYLVSAPIYAGDHE
jgi:hypothetical protein